MADRHENNWQPVRPLDDDVPDDRSPDLVVNGEPPAPAVAVDTAPVPDAKPAVQREPFRSIPIAMPPESADKLPVAPPEAVPIPPPVPSEPAAVSTVDPEVISPDAPHTGPGVGEVAGVGEPAVVGEVAVVGSVAESTSGRAATMPVVPPAEPRPIQSPPGPSGPPPPGQRMPQNQAPPQNNWVPRGQMAPPGQMPPYGQGGPQGHWGPQGQWGPQNQWSAQPGQWPQPPYPTAPHPPHPPGQVPPSPQQTQQRGAVDPPVLVPQVVAVGQGLPADRAMLQPVSARDLGNSLLVRSANVPPVSGWRRALYVMSGGRIDVGNSAAQQRRLELTAQVDRTLVGCYRVAVLSLKGGVGKTTTTATLGSTFAHIRGDRVIAIDANPDRGTLGQKVPCETTATVRNLLRDIDSVDRYSDVRAYTSQNANRLEVLASDSDPAASEAFSGEDYDRAVAMLEKFYSIVITDCGTGLMHSAMESILEGTDTLVVVSSASVDGARSASATLDWLDAHGYRTLVATSVAVVNGVRPRAGKVDLQRVIEHFEQRCAHVLTIPFDPHLEEGAEIELDRLHGRTRTALLEVAAAVAAGFPDSPTASDPS